MLDDYTTLFLPPVDEYQLTKYDIPSGKSHKLGETSYVFHGYNCCTTASGLWRRDLQTVLTLDYFLRRFIQNMYVRILRVSGYRQSSSVFAAKDSSLSTATRSRISFLWVRVFLTTLKQVLYSLYQTLLLFLPSIIPHQSTLCLLFKLGSMKMPHQTLHVQYPNCYALLSWPIFNPSKH